MTHALRAARAIARAAYRRRSALALLAMVLVSVASYAAAFAVRFEMRWPAAYTATFLATVGWLVALRVGVSFLFRLNVQRWRYSSVRDIGEILLATLVSSAVFFGILVVLPESPPVPRSVVVLEMVFASYMLGGLRMTYRFAFEWYARRVHRHELSAADRTRVLIAGAGEAGSLVCHHMVRFPELGYAVAGFVDDDPGKARTRMWGTRVLGTMDDIPALVSSDQIDIDELVVAMPSAPPAVFRRIVRICEDVDVRLTILPHERGVLQGPVSLSQLREVRIEDLLGREPIELALPDLAADLAGQSVLITGAAGSIGAELARQVALHGPARLVLYDQAETDLFYIDRELTATHPGLEVVPMIGDIADEIRVAEAFERYAPSRVYHAAAYKHVPLMETKNASEAVRNNVIGTWQVATAAGRSGTGTFVLISTDKAVNPTGVMGTTKRTAELAILACAERYPDTHFTAVRFGNVLDSQGSVIPIFRRQLAEGAKLTVTDAEATRFFMTIPEAVQLVLEASLLPEARGHIAMLDMGEPVRVLDMARSLLRLSGETHPEGRIEITRLRAGEKLHEELTFEHEETQPTVHPKVSVVRRAREQWQLELQARLRSFHGAAGPDGVGEILDDIRESVVGQEEREAIRVESGVEWTA
jgi:FlaA1/EpsC-like NDP-sugar epimerase